MNDSSAHNTRSSVCEVDCIVYPRILCEWIFDERHLFSRRASLRFNGRYWPRLWVNKSTTYGAQVKGYIILSFDSSTIIKRSQPTINKLISTVYHNLIFMSPCPGNNAENLIAGVLGPMLCWYKLPMFDLILKHDNF